MIPNQKLTKYFSSVRNQPTSSEIKMFTVTTAKNSSSLTVKMQPTSNSEWVISLIATATKIKYVIKNKGKGITKVSKQLQRMPHLQTAKKQVRKHCRTFEVLSNINAW